MANSIKFPTMLTNVLDSRHERCAQMVSDVCNLVTNYSGLPANEKFVYNYRGRARVTTQHPYRKLLVNKV